MFDVVRKSISWGDKTLTLETGRMARQADGAVLASLGDTVVLCTIVGETEAREGLDFFPLSVHYVEKTYAGGKIPGGFFKREGRPSERETLVSRLIDRPLRPMFSQHYRCETQVICTVVSHDMANESDIVALIGASAAAAISGLPFLGPIGGARVGRHEDKFILNPTIEQMEQSTLDLVMAGTSEGVLMVESEAKELDEKTMLEAVVYGHEQMQPVIAMIEEMKKEVGKQVRVLDDPSDALAKLENMVAQKAEKDLEDAYSETEKQARQAKINAVKKAVFEDFSEGDEAQSNLIKPALKNIERRLVRGSILTTKKRIDGRGCADIRSIDCQVGILPKAHGSALFTRGETQALCVTTLGTGQDEQIVDILPGEYRENFMLHYNFPPFSVGEIGRYMGAGRREIGHGKLAWRAMHPLMPSREEFPYTIRVVSEITESNGSSSMATVCGTSLSLMDAGVSLPKPVAGIAMGLIKDGEDFAILSDILGDEDHLGDMDFKMAGSADGLTSLQMDIKITSITSKIMEQALAQGRQGIDHILGIMAKVLPQTRDRISDNAPKISQITIPKDKIREVIGSGGKVIREICEVSEAKVDIDDDGTVRIAGATSESIEKAIAMVEGITADPEVGRIYDGTVVKCVDFGAFVNFLGKRDGLVHISEMAEHRVARTSDVVNEGDKVRVKVLGVDDRGKVRLSMKNL